MCDRLGISPWEVIEAASSKPFGFLPHFPGPGLGGDCIPVVPHFLAWRLREYGYAAQLIEAAHEINARMPLHVVQKVSDALNDHGLPIKGSRLLLLGMAYKAQRARHARVAEPRGDEPAGLARRRRPLLRPVGGVRRPRGHPPRERSSGRRTRFARPTASSCSRRTASSSSSRSGSTRSSSWTRATSSRPDRTSTRSSADPRARRRLRRRRGGPAGAGARRRGRARGQLVRDRPRAGCRARDARRDGRHPRARRGRVAARRAASTASSSSRRRRAGRSR